MASQFFEGGPARADSEITGVGKLPASGRAYFPNRITDPNCLIAKLKLADFQSIPSVQGDLQPLLTALTRLHMPFAFRNANSVPVDDYLYTLHGMMDLNGELIIWDYQKVIPAEPYFFIGVEVGWPQSDMDYPEFWAKYCNPAAGKRCDNMDRSFLKPDEVSQAWANWGLSATVTRTTILRESNGTLTPPLNVTTEEVNPDVVLAMLGVNYEPGNTPPFSYTNLCNVEVSAGPAEGLVHEYDNTELVKAYLGSGRGYNAVKFYPQLAGWTAGTGNLTIDEQWLLNMVRNVYRQDLREDEYGAVVGTVEAHNVTFTPPVGGDGVVCPNWPRITIPNGARMAGYPPAGLR